MSRSSSPRLTSAEHPAETIVERDLTEGPLEIGPLEVQRTDAILISATSVDGATFSVSVTHQDADGNTYQSESSTDLDLDAVAEGWSRLTRKAPEVLITITDESGAAQNKINVFVDTEP